MKNRMIDNWALLSKRAKIFYIIFTILNLMLMIALMTKAKAGFFPALIFFLFWELAIWIYYMFRYKKRKSMKGGEWIDAGMFAVIAATLIRTFFIEAYQIPTPSMEKSLLVGDFLFVSKINYGPRVPMTPISFPFVHHTLPVVGGKSYSEALKMPYYRLPGFQKIKNNDVVVFNYPAEKLGRPDDKKENYIKRCIAISGDSLRVQNGKFYLNGKKLDNPPHSQAKYRVQVTHALTNQALQELNITEAGETNTEGSWLVNASESTVEKLKALDYVVQVVPEYESPNSSIFPPSKDMGWSVDNFGPIYVPKAGDVITLDSNTYPIYEEAIRIYEKNDDFRVLNGKYYIGDQEISTYTFKMNYYFMIGDNRHFSADSRIWGFVPENHIVGKALFIWMSMDQRKSGFFKRIRWNRIFDIIH